MERTEEGEIERNMFFFLLLLFFSFVECTLLLLVCGGGQQFYANNNHTSCVSSFSLSLYFLPFFSSSLQVWTINREREWCFEFVILLFGVMMMSTIIFLLFVCVLFPLSLSLALSLCRLIYPRITPHWITYWTSFSLYVKSWNFRFSFLSLSLSLSLICRRCVNKRKKRIIKNYDY